jgi:predicted nucleic-acid-binding protein
VAIGPRAIGLDTNVLVRYIADDDPRQSPRATALIDALTSDRQGFISLVTLVELVWVMQSRYGAAKLEIVAIVEKLLRTKEFVLENPEVAIQALDLFKKSKVDFADCLIARSAHKAGCEYSVTFDRVAAKGAGMRLLD